MWFKNLKLFQFSEPFKETAEILETRLADSAFSPCSAMSAMSMGWVPPLDQDEAPLVHCANGFMMICLKIQEKILPATVVREELNEKIKEIEEAQDRKVFNKEKKNLRDDIYQNLLSRALCKSSKIYAYIDTQEQLMVVNTSSQTKAELLTTVLRKTLGSLKTIIPETQDPVVLMTDWLQNPTNNHDFVIEDFCVLTDQDGSGGSVRCNQQDLSSDTIHNLLNEGKHVTQLGLRWSEQLSFVLKDDLTISKIKYLESVIAQVDDIFTESEAARFDADFTIMTETLRALLKVVFAYLGKEQTVPAKKSAELASA